MTIHISESAEAYKLNTVTNCQSQKYNTDILENTIFKLKKNIHNSDVLNT